MTTLNATTNFDLNDLTNDQPVPADSSLWSRILERVGDLIGKPWSYLNEDMGTLNIDEEPSYFGDCCL